MKKTLKCGITAAVFVAAGIAAYQNYDSYGVQDNSLLMQNVEALASGADAEGDSDAGADQVTNKALKWTYSEKYFVKGLKLDLDLKEALIAQLQKLIGRSVRADDQMAGYVRMYAVYDPIETYREECLRVPGANCICNEANNSKWMNIPQNPPKEIKERKTHSRCNGSD